MITLKHQVLSDEEIATLHMATEKDVEESMKVTKLEIILALDKLRHFTMSIVYQRETFIEKLYELIVIIKILKQQ